LGGIAATAVGVLALKEQSVFEKLVDDTLYRSSANVLIGTGICIILFVVPGCYGAVKETKCFLLLVSFENFMFLRIRFSYELIP
jgi:hypothetical protein